MLRRKEIKAVDIKKKYFFATFFLAIIVISYNLLWINRTFTLSEGWSRIWCGLISNGKIPYKDFYYYLPPLNLIFDLIFNKISSGYFIIYRLLRLIERVIVVEILFLVLKRRLPVFYSLMACFLTVVFACANPMDTGGDYNQTAQLFVVLWMAVLNKYVETDDKSKWLYLLLSGVVLGGMFWVKQPVFVSSVLTFIVIALLFSVISKKIQIKYILYVCLGIFIPIACLFVWLLFKGALRDFIYQVYLDSDSKGSLFRILIGSQINLIKERVPIFFAIILFAFACDVKYLNGKNSIRIANICYILSTFLFGIQYGSYLWHYVYSLKYIVVIIMAISLIVGFRYYKIGRILLVVESGIIMILMIINYSGTTEMIYSDYFFRFVFEESLTVIYLYLIIRLLIDIGFFLVKKKKIDNQEIVVNCCAIAGAYSTSMAAGAPVIHSISSFVLIGALFFHLSKYLQSQERDSIDRIKQIVLSQLVVFFIVICFGQKLFNLYEWWGFKSGTFWEKTEVSSQENLKGFLFTHEEIDKFDKITELLEYYSDDSSVIYGYPYVKVYNALLNNYNMDCFAPIHFYDVCSDKYAIADAKILSENEPDIVIWMDIPGCVENHELSYKEGNKLGQREIMKWFSGVCDTDYVLVGQVDNIFVYKHIDDNEVTLKLIENKFATNETLMQDW